MAPDIGIPLAPGTRVIMQVHYNLLAGTEPDTSAPGCAWRQGPRS